MCYIPLSIFDTTLRDGEQAPGNAMTVTQKVELAVALDALGVNVIETGFPAASDNDFETAKKLSECVKNAKLCVFARAANADIQTAFHAICKAKNFQLEIMTTVSDIHLTHKRGITRSESLKEAYEAVRFAVEMGFEDICVGPEDATRADLDFLRLMIDTVLRAGATALVIPDTVGCCLPEDFERLISQVRSCVGLGIPISCHAHDDLGLATANTLAAISGGANECQVTLCGIGERAGNAALEQVVAAVISKPEVFKRTVTVDSTQIGTICRRLIRMVGSPFHRSKPIVGENAFATAAGIHQSGILRDPTTYEYLDPARFGATRQLIFARHSGRQALRTKYASLDVALSESELESAYQKIKTYHASVFTDSELLSLLQ